MKKLLSFLLVTLFVAAPAAADPVADAYRSIPHNQTTYSSGLSSLLSANAKMIEQILNLSDLALVERVQAADWLISGGRRGRNFTTYEKNIKSIIARLEAAESAGELEAPKRLILEAIGLQRDFLVEQYNAAYSSKSYRWPAGFRDDPRVQSAHQKLLEAYNLLNKAYPGEVEHNRKAFFDHLCALDYL